MSEKGPPPAYSSVQNNEYSGKKLVWDPVQQMHVIAGENGRPVGSGLTGGGVVGGGGGGTAGRGTGGGGGGHVTGASPTINVSKLFQCQSVSQVYCCITDHTTL